MSSRPMYCPLTLPIEPPILSRTWFQDNPAFDEDAELRRLEKSMMDYKFDLVHTSPSVPFGMERRDANPPASAVAATSGTAAAGLPGTEPGEGDAVDLEEDEEEEEESADGDDDMTDMSDNDSNSMASELPAAADIW